MSRATQDPVSRHNRVGRLSGSETGKPDLALVREFDRRLGHRGAGKDECRVRSGCARGVEHLAMGYLRAFPLASR